MPSRPWIFVCIFAAFAGACQPAPHASPGSRGSDASQATSGRAGQASREAQGPIAYVGGQAVYRTELLEPMIEAIGGEVLAELVLDRAIAERLEGRGVKLAEDDLAAERRRVREALSDDEDEAARLLEELRRQRGLGERRFEAFVWRNAGLRRLVAGQVQVDDDAVRQAYDVRYGPRYRVRVIVVERFEQASRLRRQVVEQGASFSDLAATHSTDASADRGGLLSPISPADASYPPSLREVLPGLGGGEGEANRVSDVIALDGQFALVRLEEKIEPENVEFADVRDRLEADVRRRLEQRHMRQLARELLGEANVTVLDPALGRSWRQQRGLLLTP